MAQNELEPLPRSIWGRATEECRVITRRYQVTYRYLTNRLIFALRVALMISMLLSLVMVTMVVTVDTEELYVADGTRYSCILPEPTPAVEE